MTREQFEAHVRADAEAKYPANTYRDMGQFAMAAKSGYIAARMEHE